MKFKTKLKLLTTGLIFSSFIFAVNQEIDIENRACLDKGACPKILELAKVGSLKANKVSSKSLNKNIISTNTISITNKSKKGVTTIIAASSQGKKTSCGQFSVPGKASIEVNVSCDIYGSTYSLADFDGRSNVIDVSSSPREFLYAFVTSEIFSGALGGIEGAQVTCKQLADKGVADIRNLRWDACLSSTSSNAYDRFQPEKMTPYRMPNMDKVVDSLESAVKYGSILTALTITETGDINTIVNDFVWTNTRANGNTYSITAIGVSDCDGFTSKDGSLNPSIIGLSTSSEDWTVNNSNKCSASARLYCFEKINS